NPTAVNELAEKNDLSWFENNVIMTVPFPHPGMMRRVYPGFLQLTGFMSMNLDRHMTAQRKFYNHLIEGDGESAEKHREFYDEYLAVMDLTAEFYLQTVDTVFIRRALATGDMMHRDKKVNTDAIKRVALFTVEGEKDDISGVGQTEAAHRLCSSLPDDMRAHYVQPSVGHYGVFNGSRFRSGIRPRISDFVNSFDDKKSPASSASKPVAKAQTKPKPAKKPTTLDAILLAKPEEGVADDLKAISGIGPKLENTLHEMGIFHFAQIAQLTAQQIAQLDDRLSFKGRIERDGWVVQAKALVAGVKIPAK
ncbi:MAG: polyhydroxyalkanoate depolymerase, partial [Pseudomonadota bacterium]